ncbi:hypothetical protein IPZ58_16290 [Streptomyces roseoverticillatus]|uniref:hypothetical protein n=1 Tax=Streptomyces roseoverticillatus TaxID=66429 RepID=UPI001F46EB67|nr:hypothetical protein [Streptomyces roseoverticillatus]MCF3103133.1 hypothetical protein [Streptomyces roseoverticillatus]
MFRIVSARELCSFQWMPVDFRASTVPPGLAGVRPFVAFVDAPDVCAGVSGLTSALPTGCGPSRVVRRHLVARADNEDGEPDRHAEAAVHEPDLGRHEQ